MRKSDYTLRKGINMQKNYWAIRSIYNGNKLAQLLCLGLIFGIMTPAHTGPQDDLIYQYARQRVKETGRQQTTITATLSATVWLRLHKSLLEKPVSGFLPVARGAKRMSRKPTLYGAICCFLVILKPCRATLKRTINKR